MQYIVYILFFSVSCVHCIPQDILSGSTKECKVIEKATGKEKSCQFPFIYNNKTFHGCTNEDNGENGGKDWCSTKTNPLNEHDAWGDFFGQCSEDCLTAEEGQEIEDSEVKLETSFVTRTLDLFGFQTASPACTCEPFRQCKAHNDLVALIERLRPGSINHRSKLNFFRNQICDAKSNSVWCCRDGDFATPAELKELNEKNDESATMDSGRWRPNGLDGECGKRITLSNIVGGKTTKLGDFPYMALIGYDPASIPGNEIFYRCGGSLINKWYVLTAAHCILEGNRKEGENGKPVEIVLGDWRVSTDPDCNRKKKCAPKKITRTPKEIIIHENYGFKKGTGLYQNDIALIRLNEPVPLSSEDLSKSLASPVCLPWSDYLEDSHPARDIKDLNNEGEIQEVVITGWGRHSNTQSLTGIALTDVLQEVALPVTNEIKSCKSGLSGTPQVCIGGIPGPKNKRTGKPKYHKKDSCGGDSGGPAVYREFSGDPWYQVGIVSYGAKTCARGRIPGFYTKVSEFLPWIQSKLKD